MSGLGPDRPRHAHGISSRWTTKANIPPATARLQGLGHADGYSGFNDLFGHDMVDEMGCMAHVWRKFVDVFASLDNAIAEEAIRRIAALYAVEKEARGKSASDRVALRRARAKPMIDDLETWLHAQLFKISGKSPLVQAIRYALGRMPKARPYLGHGHLEFDSSTAERAVKPVATGRKTGYLQDRKAAERP